MTGTSPTEARYDGHADWYDAWAHADGAGAMDSVRATLEELGLAAAVLDLPQGEVLVVTGVLVALTAVAVVIATNRRLGLPRTVEAAGYGRPGSCRPSS